MALLPLKTALAAGYMLVAAGCPTMPQVDDGDVEMNFTHRPPVIQSDKPSTELGTYNISTTFSRSRNEIFSVGGLHISEFAPRYVVTYNVQSMVNGLTCIAPAAINITVEYEPRILLASEFKKGTCMHKEILEHEMRHVNIDIITFNEMLPSLQESVQKAAKAIQPMGPMPPSSLEKAKGLLTDRIRDALVAAVDEIELIRFNRQQLIDTRQEYLRVSNACRH